MRLKYYNSIHLKFLLIMVTKSVHLLKVFPDDTLSTCDGINLKPGELYNGTMFNVNMTFDLQEDNTVLMTGGFFWKVKIDKPFWMRVTGDKLTQGQYTTKATKTNLDGCFDLFNPLDVFFNYFKEQKRCPLKPGVSRILYHFIVHNYRLKLL